MESETAVTSLLALAGISLLIGVLAVGRVLWRARGFPKTALQFVSLAGGFFCLVAGSTLLYVGTQFQQRMRGAIEYHGRPVPELNYQLVTGGPVLSAQQWRGRTVLLNVWATWCQPCRAELAELARLQKLHGADKLLVVAISDEDPATVAEFLKTNPVEMDITVVSRRKQDPAPFFFNLPVRPVSFVIDSGGIVRESRVGAMTGDELARMMAPYLK